MRKIDLTEDNIDDVLSGTEGVVLEFYAERCASCRTLFRILDETETEGAVLGKVDVDAAPGLAARFGVVRIPTLVAVRNGKEVKRLSGLQSKSAIAALLDEATK